MFYRVFHAFFFNIFKMRDCLKYCPKFYFILLQAMLTPVILFDGRKILQIFMKAVFFFDIYFMTPNTETSYFLMY